MAGAGGSKSEFYDQGKEVIVKNSLTSNNDKRTCTTKIVLEMCLRNLSDRVAHSDCATVVCARGAR